MKHARSLIYGALGFALAYGATLPTYHHLAGVVRADCATCLVSVANNTAELRRQSEAARVTSATD